MGTLARLYRNFLIGNRCTLLDVYDLTGIIRIN